MPIETPSEAARRLSPSGMAAADGGGAMPYEPEMTPELLRLVKRSPGPAELPRPATAADLEQLRQRLREWQFALGQESKRLDALRKGLQKAENEHRVARAVLTEAEQDMRNARTHSRAHLVAAFINGEEAGTVSVASVEAEAKLAADHLRDAEELVKAITEEIAGAEFTVRERTRERDQALSLLVSSSPEFLHLYRRLRSTWAKLRGLRVCILKVADEVGTGLPNRLLDLAQVNEPLDNRHLGYKWDSDLVDRWVAAVARLRDDAETKLPNNNGRD